MSAWLVDRAHIDALTYGLLSSETVVGIDPDTVGLSLWLENLNSVRHRYPRDASGERPGPTDLTDEDIKAYRYRRPTVVAAPDVLLKALHCYGYQSCEHSTWERSPAYSWTTALVENLQRAGYVPCDGLTGWDLQEQDVLGSAGVTP